MRAGADLEGGRAADKLVPEGIEAPTAYASRVFVPVALVSVLGVLGTSAIGPLIENVGAVQVAVFHLVRIVMVLLSLGNASSSLARVTFEVLGPVPVADLTVSTSVERPGRSVELLSAALSHAGRPRAFAPAGCSSPVD